MALIVLVVRIVRRRKVCRKSVLISERYLPLDLAFDSGMVFVSTAPRRLTTTC